MIGHFTVMANDKNNAVGCALVHYQDIDYKYNYFVCNYGYTNIPGEQVYESGKAASKCAKAHPDFKGLCYTKDDAENSAASHTISMIMTLFVFMLKIALEWRL